MKTGLALLLICGALPLMEAGTFWYFDDLHYDPTYGAANESCYENPKLGFNPKGSYYCDAPWALVEDSIKKMKENMANPNFIVWAGDTGHHPLTRTTVLSKTTLYQALQNVTNLLQREFPSVRVLPLLGNHDWLPKNKLPAQDEAGGLYEQYANLFQGAGWLSVAEAQTFKKAGYFATTLAGNNEMRIIVLNTNLYLKKNDATSGDDPAGQLEFLRNELQMVRQNNQKAYIFTHVPLGNNGIRSPYDESFVDIITEYAPEIKSMHGAHEHVDRFRLIYAKGDDNAKAFQIITPAITPWVGGRPYPRNPSFAGFQYNDNDLTLEDMTLYYLNLANNNAAWVKLYSFRETYNQPINLDSLKEIKDKLQNDEEFYQDYYRRMWVNIGTDFMKNCDEECRKEELCLIQYARNSDLSTCLSGAGISHQIHQMALLTTLLALAFQMMA